MSDCETEGSDRIAIDAGVGMDPSAGEVTTDLVDPESDEPGAAWSLRCDHSVHDAIVHGLAQYMWGVRITALGRIIRLNRVTEHHAEAPDEHVPYPVAVVTADQSEGRYTAPVNRPTFITRPTAAQLALTSPGIVPMAQEPVRFIEPGTDDIINLVGVSVYAFDQLLVTVTCETTAERAQMAKAIEDASNPHVGVGGFRLRLRHYFGAVARFTLESQVRPDNAADALNASWMATFRYRVECPNIRAHRTKRAIPRTQVSVT